MKEKNKSAVSWILTWAGQKRIVQQGTHEQLMKQEGIYKRFVDAR